MVHTHSADVFWLFGDKNDPHRPPAAKNSWLNDQKGDSDPNMILFFDTETTGVSKYKDHLVQLAWVLCDASGSILAKRSSLVRPTGFSIPQAASRIHGITTDFAQRNGSPISTVLREFAADAARAERIVAHNMQFDFGILQTAYQSAGASFPLAGKSQVCTMRVSTDWCKLPKLDGRPGHKYPKLPELHYFLFKRGFDGEHDALQDTLACMRCYFELMRLDVIDGLKYAGAPKLRKKATGSNAVPQTLKANSVGTAHVARGPRLQDRQNLAERERFSAEKQRHDAVAKAEAQFQAAENEIRAEYSKKLDAISDPGNFFLWWFCSGVVVASLIATNSRNATDGGILFGAIVLGWFPAFFFRQLYRENLEKPLSYVACVKERDRKVAEVRMGSTPTAFAQAIPRSPTTHPAEPRREASGSSRGPQAHQSSFSTHWVFDSITSQLGEIKTGMIFGPTQYQKEALGLRVIASKWANFNEVHFLHGDHPWNSNPVLWKDNLLTALLESMQRILVPTGRQGSQNATSNSSCIASDANGSNVIAKWVFDSRSGDLFELETNMMFDQKLYQRTAMGFHVLMFKWAEYPEVHFLQKDNPLGSNPRLEYEAAILAWMEKINCSVVKRFADTTGARSGTEHAANFSPLEAEPTRQAATTHTISPEQSANVAAYIAKKNEDEVERLQNHLSPQVPLVHVEPPPLEISMVQSEPKPVHLASIELSHQWEQWCSDNIEGFTRHSDDFGFDLVVHVAKQCANICRRELPLMPRANTAFQNDLRELKKHCENFGSDLVGMVVQVAHQCLDHHADRLSRPTVPDFEQNDVENFGADLVGMVGKVVEIATARRTDGHPISMVSLQKLVPVDDCDEDEDQEENSDVELIPLVGSDGAIDMDNLAAFAELQGLEMEDRRKDSGGLWILEQKYCREQVSEIAIQHLKSAGFKRSSVRSGWYASH